MALITFKIEDHFPGGMKNTTGHVVFEPSHRHITDGTTLHTVAPFTVNYHKDFTVDLENTQPNWAWKITVNSTRGEIVSGYYIVSQDDYFVKLTSVDPVTLEPDADPEPAWWAMARSTIISGEVNSNGDLILTRTDGGVVNAGHVEGRPGLPGDPGRNGNPGKDGANGKSAGGWLDVRDFGVSAGEIDNTGTINTAIAHALSVGSGLAWPLETFNVVGNLVNLHRVSHVGRGVISREGSTFHVEPLGNQANTLHVASWGVSTNDGVSPDQPMDRLSTAFNALPNYGEILVGSWSIELDSGVYNDQAITGQRSQKRLMVVGSVDIDGEPTTFIEPGSTGFTKAVGGNNNLNIGLRNIHVRNYLTANVPAIDFSTHCDIWLDNVVGSNNDIGYRIINLSKYRMSGCRWENNKQYGGLELFSVVRDTKGSVKPTVFRGNLKVGLKAKELCTGHLDDTEFYDNKHGIHFSRSCTANGTNAKIKRNQYGLTLQNQSSFVPLLVDWGIGTVDQNIYTPWDLEGNCSFVTNENESVAPETFPGRGESLMGSYAPENATVLTGTTTPTVMCTLGVLKKGSLARPGGYIRLVVIGFKSGTSATANIDVRLGGVGASVQTLPATTGMFKLDIIMYSRGRGRQTVLALDELSNDSRQLVQREYNIDSADWLIGVRATLGSAADGVTIHGAWCYTTEALNSL